MPHSSSQRFVLVGNESLLIQCAERLRERGCAVAAVVTSRPAVRRWAAGQGVRVLREVAGLSEARDLQPFDYLVSVTNLSVLGPDILALPTRGAINFHDGPLPEYAGLNTPVWALLQGATTHGITWHRMTAEVDRGDILVERRFAVDADETSLTINTKNYEAGYQAFEELLDGLAAGTLVARPQDRPIERYFGRQDRPAAMASIDWRASALDAVRLVRALDFGTYANPVASAKVSLRGRALRVVKAVVAGPVRRWAAPEADRAPSGGSERSELGGQVLGHEPGSVVAADDAGITVAARDAFVALQGFETLDGRVLTPAQAAAYWTLGQAPMVGQRLDVLDDTMRARLSEINARVAPHETFWLRRLESRDDIELAYVDRKAKAAEPRPEYLDTLVEGGEEHRRAELLALVWLLLARLADKDSFDVGFRDDALAKLTDGGCDWFATQVPLRAQLDFGASFEALTQAAAAELDNVAKRGSFARDAIGRTPELRAAAAQADPTHQAIVVQWSERIDAASLASGSELTIAFDESGRSARWCWDASRLERRHVEAMQRQFACLLRAAAHEPKRSVGELPLLTQDELDRVVVEWNATAGEVRSGVGVHHLIEQQAARTPERTAITAQGVSITYGELDARANRLARRLAALGVKPDVLVGLMCDRSVEMMVGLLAIHKAGGAYVPLDPTYPRDRIAMMVEDSKLAVLLTMERLRGEVPLAQGHVIAIDGDWPAIEAESAEAFDGGALPEHLAYVIYTSGSTGRPKGVMVEHRNVVNFFAGMDRHLAEDESTDPAAVNTWLAVTSLSFDISVLELCWTLTRGYHVVISSDEDRSAAAPQGQHAQRPIDFSLFYFSSDESEAGVDDKYRLLIEGSKYADQHGFAAVWTPERHFNAFGGLYPNPAVTGAAIATITKKVQIRSGSVVAPLHHPLRIAEEWSVVDNLSHGRVGLSFASGWHPNDFVLRPQNFKDAKKVMVDTVDTVRALWRGEARSFEGPLGNVEVRVLPRPVQKELPFWVTSAGNVETFEIAGRIGANVLTHLLGQTVEELRSKLEAYRRARREAGHAGEGIVSLMLHTFVGPDESVVRAKVKQPLIEYLRSSANLVKQYAWAFPAFKRRGGMNTSVDAVDLSTVSKEEMDALLEFSFERYYEASGLFGTPERCMSMIDKLKGIGVDDVACLIDFGVDSKSVLEHLPYLNQLRKLSKPPRVMSPEFALPALLARHAVTHLQCTPSMARLLLLDDAARPGLAKLRRMMVGGEALQPQLAKELTGLIAGKLMNMYGPTETTIWSAVHTLDRRHEGGPPPGRSQGGPAPSGGSERSERGGTIPLGRPLANQQIYILDRRQQPLPVGVPGELVIGGKGVVRGYLHRPELTAERFVHVAPGGTGAQRVYRTGDLAKFRDDGTIEFLGRLDHQVKVRGYRIELGEIEALIARRPEVSETVVVAREDVPGDVRLVAYLVAKPGMVVAPAELRESLRDLLPEFMVPGHVVVLDAMPQTPNGKIDRKQLPAPEHADDGARTEYVAPTGDLEGQIVEVWKDVLKLPKVGVRDNFFDLGGHSLLAIQLLRALKGVLQRDLAITDVFRFPTVQALAAHLSSDASAHGAAAKQGQDRAQGRRAAMARRQGARETTPS